MALVCCTAGNVLAQRGPGRSKPQTETYNYIDLETNLKGWGVKAGLNFSNIFGLEDINTGNRTGFHVGGLYKRPMLSWLAFQAEGLFSRRALYFKVPGATERTFLSMDYIDVPLLLYMYPFDNMTIHIGPQASLLTGIRQEKQKVSTEGFNRFELGAAGGIEFKVYALRVGARYNLGLRNLLDNSEASRNQIFSQDSGWNEENFRNASLQAYIAVHFSQSVKPKTP